MARFDNNRDLIVAENEALHGQLAEAVAENEEQRRRFLALQAQLANEQQQLADRNQQIQQLQLGQQLPAAPNNNVESILKEMQTPQIIRDLPCFTGNPVKLNSFIKAIDRLMPTLERMQGSAVFDVWMQAIRAKITSDADAVLELYGTDTDWADIKSTLTTHFSDKRDEISLTRDLFKLTQTSGVQEFYGSISHSISLLVNLLHLNEPDPVVVASKKRYYQEIGLKVFVAGLKEPLGPIIRAQAPKTLKDALRLCLEESNFNYVKSPFRGFPHPPPPPPNPTAIPKSYAFPQQMQPLPFRPVVQQQRPSQFPQQRLAQFPQPKPMVFPQQQRPFQFPPAQRPFQPFGQQFRQQGFQPKPNMFTPKQNFPKPTPMEVDPSLHSRQVNYMNRNVPHFQFEEYSDDYYYNDYCYPMFEGSEIDFHEEQLPENPEGAEVPSANEGPVQVEDLNFRQREKDSIPT